MMMLGMMTSNDSRDACGWKAAFAELRTLPVLPVMFMQHHADSKYIVYACNYYSSSHENVLMLRSTVSYVENC